MPHDIDAIKSKLTPIDVVLRYTHQDAAPHKNIRCPNQTHEDRNPSCRMDYVTGLWKCFGCSAQGDILDFIGYALFRDYDIASRPHFSEMLDMLAGIRVTPESPHKPETQHRNTHIKLNLDRYQAMLEGWTGNLLMHTKLLDWLEDRGISQSTICDMRLGYITKNDDRVYAGCRNRIILPNVYRGILVAVKYRSLPWHEKVYKSFEGSSLSMMYNAQSLLAPHDIAILQESEFDANAIISIYGKGIASVATPAHTFNMEKALQLEYSRYVIHIADDDEAGRQMASDVKRLMDRVITVFAPRHDLGETIQYGMMLNWLTDHIRALR